MPDPTGTGGYVTPRMHALYQALAALGATTGGASCWDRHLHNPDSDHPRGKACDIFFNPRDPADVARGWQIAHWLTAQHHTYGIRYLIWQGRIWMAENPSWATYHSDIYGCPNPANVTGCHYDHGARPGSWSIPCPGPARRANGQRGWAPLVRSLGGVPRARAADSSSEVMPPTLPHDVGQSDCSSGLRTALRCGRRRRLLRAPCRIRERMPPILGVVSRGLALRGGSGDNGERSRSTWSASAGCSRAGAARGRRY